MTFAENLGNIKTLQETYDARVHPSGRNRSEPVSPEAKKLAKDVEFWFDYENQTKLLAAGSGVVNDTNVPAIFERNVIKEALFNLRALQFVDSGAEKFAPAIDIPYSYRDVGAAGANNTNVYEGQEIPRAGIIQKTDLAYPIPQKIAFEVSDELRHLTAGENSPLKWEAIKEAEENNARIIAEDIDRLIYNKMLLASDQYQSVSVSGENPGSQADGTKRVLLLNNFPVVRPESFFDLSGLQIGTTTNPVNVTYNGTQIFEFDGTGTQRPGTYFALNYNLGEIYLTDENGVIQTPGNGTAWSVDYSWATNVFLFDADLGANSTEDHWDTFLYRYALRKLAVEDNRFYRVNFGLMSGTAMTQIEQAKQFAANFKRPGTDLTESGNLGRIKDVPNWSVSGPGLHYGDHRVLLGQRGVTRFRYVKLWRQYAIENQRGPNGRFTGKKTAYGDQWVVIHTPEPLKAAYTSLVIYSGSARVARVSL